MTHYTLEDLAAFTQKEKQMMEEVLYPDLHDAAQPSDQCVKAILDYARAVSIRPGKKLDHYAMVLN
jgi:hypothetical protein